VEAAVGVAGLVEGVFGEWDGVGFHRVPLRRGYLPGPTYHGGGSAYAEWPMRPGARQRAITTFSSA
jgi:hypothetical protein